MSVAGPWAELGIAPTGDTALIRRAYSRRLRAIDPDANAEAFHRLRAAYEQALEGGASGEAAPTPPDRASVSPFPAHGPLLEIRAILARPPEPGEAERVHALAAELLAHPAVQAVDVARELGAELVQLIFHEPRAEPMLGPVIAHFGWQAAGERWDDHPLVAELVQRHRGNELLAQLSAPEHPLHGAYLELSRSHGPVDLRRIDAIVELLRTIRREAPAAEDRLNPARLNLYFDFLDRHGTGDRPRDFLAENYRDLRVVVDRTPAKRPPARTAISRFREIAEYMFGGCAVSLALLLVTLTRCQG